jgi:competence protein ComEC
MKRPFVILAMSYSLGIILVNYMRVGFWLIFGLGVITAILACLNFRNNRIFVILAFLLASMLGALNLKNSYMRHKCDIGNFVSYHDNAVYNLGGFVDSQPVIKNKNTIFVFQVQEAQVNNLKWPCCGKIFVRLGFSQVINYAERFILTGTLRPPFGFSPASRSYRRYLYTEGIYLLMDIESSLQVIPQSGKGGSKMVIFSLWLRDKLEQLLRRYLSDLPAGILSAMLLGQRNSVPWLVYDNMIKSGTVHILVVSGFNVGIVAFIVNLILKIMRIRRKARIILTVICLLIYCLITGASNPVIRATVMGIVFLLAYLFKRETDIYNCLACAALFILTANPRQLFDVGFQLSFASVLAIACLYPKLKSFLRPDNYKFRLMRFICECFLVSLCAWIGTAGIIAHNFRIVSPVTVLANILIVPLATLITLCGFSLVICGYLCPFLGRFLSITTAMFINLFLNINAAVIKIPGAYFYF